MAKSIFRRSLVSGFVALALSSGAAVADDQKSMSKPESAKGIGVSKPFTPKSNAFWWPDQLDLSALRDHDRRSNPYGEGFDYAEAFNQLDLEQVMTDVDALLTDSQDWWPADWGNYGPFFIRLSWHSAGTYRTLDGRGGGEGAQMRFDPLNSWPDNGNLDKAKRLLWPVKQKYGRALSWGDLMILAGTVGMKNMGFDIYGFAGGRTDDWEPDMVYWGPEVEMLASDREERDGKLQRPLGATHMGLIYVNPEGPKGKPDPMGSAKNIRTAFSRMAMNDEETVALIAGGHTFGKMHGAHKAGECLDVEPGAAAVEEQGLGWKNKCGKGNAEDTVTSGLEGAWTQAPTRWTTLYLSNLLNNEWEQTRSPGGAIIWVPKDKAMHEAVPDAHVKGKKNPPVMTTADLALKYDPEYRKIAERFLANPDAYQQAFAKAWFKLTHRDMGPRDRYLGNQVPDEKFLWQDPVQEIDYDLVTPSQVETLKAAILDTDVSVATLVKAAWGAAASFRASDMRGGATGGRIRLEPQVSWEVNDPAELNKVLAALEKVRSNFNSKAGDTQISMADIVVLGGAAAIEKAAADAGYDITVPFTPGRADATAAQTDVESFALLEPSADAFRNYFNQDTSYRGPADMLVDKADQLNLTVPEMTALVGGLRVLGANTGGSEHGVFTDNPGQLSNDFFVNLVDMGVKWRKTDDASVYEGLNRETGEVLYTATPVDLIFGSNSELRAVTEVYAYDGAEEQFVNDFVDAWTKVMLLDRFDLRHDLNASIE
ncbi:catalase/peroxidase HPI [Alteromonas sp. ASW11-19]|uniref:Catalase-peroxidase n=1 Tax=Alteromonas salexigens TaxID=2982530 RepID=A0ABT2VR34_9ALTE|nr:catalase/peroxidase HPI [Alteromonas salexigens]MCU7555347.1 catalase/peroxidase HPI [Alteromonas salexigens]